MNLKRLLFLPAAAALWLAVAAPAGAATSYADLPGDAGTTPDIGAVSVANSPDGQLTFQIAIPNEPELAPDARILMLLDTDLNPGTGFA